MRRLILALVALLLATPVGAQVFTGTTTLNDPIYNRPVANASSPPTNLSGVGTAVHFDVLPFMVSANGSYSFSMEGLNPVNWDTYLGLYSGSFNPASPLTNALIYNDDNPTIGLSGFSANLTTGTSYIAVLTGFANTDVGDWRLTIRGPGQATTGGAVPEPATWAMLIAGFGVIGAATRVRRRRAVFA